MSERYTAPFNDPWKGLRGVMSGTLILEAIVVLLALPIVARLGGGVTWVSGGYIVLVALALVMACRYQSHPRALAIDCGLQLAVFAGLLFHWSIGIVAIVFGLVWAYIATVKRDVARRLERGMLPGQEPIAD